MLYQNGGSRDRQKAPAKNPYLIWKHITEKGNIS